ncbi:MAG: T9SS type A sorting domain-containing protein, partial [bacterium]|nr:T9SS type A sorting domain-containing protein [bacterium]
ATPVALGRPISAEIGNGWGDDEDVYRFRLLEMATLAVEAVGEADPAIALYDRFGQRLETAVAGEGRALVVRTLSPGAYFVRVVGGGAGSYELSVASPSW